ncbi:hypothetical protein Leryth_010200 [Lithospermum erythrorhizon]|nr:hypothetical protein Leryth_010200 [Lithospermum erythrorhizon]
MAPEPVSVNDFQELAKRSLPKMYYDFYAGGAEDEHTLKQNVEAFHRIVVLVDVSRIDTSTTILGYKTSSPLMIAPTAMHKLAHPEDIIFHVNLHGGGGCIKLQCSSLLSAICTAFSKDPFILLAVNNGSALVLTPPDVPRLDEERQTRTRLFSPTKSRKAVEVGVAGIIVSNHGGRQLDYSPATINVLEEVVLSVQGKIPVLFDGGVRRGTDIFKALCLGAQAVLGCASVLPDGLPMLPSLVISVSPWGDIRSTTMVGCPAQGCLPRRTRVPTGSEEE